MNSYTLEVYSKQDKPCFVVTIKHIIRAGVYFFNSMIDAREFIAKAKKELNLYAELSYDNEGCTDIDYINVIKIVLSCENIKIGENGKTYYK